MENKKTATGTPKTRKDSKMEQESFSRLWDGYATDKDAMKARNARAKEIRTQGRKARCWTLANQTKPYDGLGQPNGDSCNVYMINIYG